MRIGPLRQLILDYATNQPLFTTPTAINDPIEPQPAEMSQAQFNLFFSTLSAVLADAGVDTELRLGELRSVQTWADLAAVVFGRQSE